MISATSIICCHHKALILKLNLVFGVQFQKINIANA